MQERQMGSGEMSRYASTTMVSPERSRNEIEAVLARYGADGFAYATERGTAQIAFRAHQKAIRFTVPLPKSADFERTKRGRLRSGEGAKQAAYEQALRQRWRSLALAIKAKLEAVESGITSFEEEFLAHIVTHGGKTIGEWAVPQLGAVVSGRLALMAGDSDA